jgi:acetyl esterase/lipase
VVATPSLRDQVPPAFDHPFLRFVGPIASLDDLVVARSFDRTTEVVADVSCERVELATNDHFVYRPVHRSAPSGAILWIHGGGLLMGRAEASHEFCSAVARDLGIVVVSVNYRLAPEHPFPAGFEDCVASWRWLMAHTEALGVDPSRIAVGGDSAGGGLAAALAQWVRDTHEGALAGQLLKYPMLDDRTTERSDREGLIWLAASNRFAWSAYLRTTPPETPYAVPGRRATCEGLAPAWIGVGTLDLFYDEDCQYAADLTAAGVPTTLVTVPLMYHGTDVLRPDAPAMVNFHASFLRAAAMFTGAAVG